MRVRLRGTAVESAAEPEPGGVTDRPEILSDASRVILKSQAPRGGHSHDGGGAGDLRDAGIFQLAGGGHKSAKKGNGLVGRKGLLHLRVEACLDGRRIVAIDRLNEFVGHLGEARWKRRTLQQRPW